MGKSKNILWTIGVVLAILSSIFIYNAVGGASSIVGLLFLLAALAIVGISGYILWHVFFFKKKNLSHTDSVVVIDALTRVFKVVTAEGQFTEIVDFKDTKLVSILTSSKKALIINKAKVSMGYDFSKIEWHIDEMEGNVVIKKIPEPHIISITPDIKYYDIKNGLFNKFTVDDLNAIQLQCMDQIREVALQSDLPKIAETQVNVMLKELVHLYHIKIEEHKALGGITSLS